MVATSLKRILVTGSAGVLGSAIRDVAAEYPNREFVFFTREDCDLRDRHASLEAIGRIAPQAILHLAAVSGGVTLTRRYPATVLRDNVLMTLNVLEACRLLGVKKVVMTLSSGMYPPTAPMPYREESLHDGPAHESNYSYAYAKRLIEPAIRAYHDEYGMNTIGLIPNAIFGPHEDFDTGASTFIEGLLRRFWENRKTEAEVVVWGDGAPLRELTYSEDMARAFMWCLLHYDSPDILNVGSTEELSIKEVALAIGEELGIDPKRIVFDRSKPPGVFRKATDNSKFVRLSGFKYMPFREGLRETIQWFKVRAGSGQGRAAAR